MHRAFSVLGAVSYLASFHRLRHTVTEQINNIKLLNEVAIDEIILLHCKKQAQIELARGNFPMVCGIFVEIRLPELR